MFVFKFEEYELKILISILDIGLTNKNEKHSTRDVCDH